MVCKIIFFGDVGDIEMRESLNFLYASIPHNMKKKYKYKNIIRELRNKMGILNVLHMFDNYGLLDSNQDEIFLSWIRAL